MMTDLERPLSEQILKDNTPEEEEKILSSDSINTQDQVSTFTVELPRDILTAYILIHTTGDWVEYTFSGKIAIMLAVIIPLFVQVLVTIKLLADINLSDVKIGLTADVLLNNLVSLVVLFIYMFKDIASIWQSTWYYLGRIENEGGANYNILDIHVSDFENRMKNIHHIRSNLNALKTTAGYLNPMNMNIVQARRNINYLQFRLLIIGILIMYLCLLFYAMCQINNEQDIVSKLEVALSVFFILELDDWSYLVFFGQNGILDDAQFDIEMPLELPPENKMKMNELHLWFSLFGVFIAVILVVVASVFM